MDIFKLDPRGAYSPLEPFFYNRVPKAANTSITQTLFNHSAYRPRLARRDNPKYKLDIYDKNGEYITSCGAYGYKDYPTYIKERGLEYANRRRELYKIRHNKDRIVKGSRGYYADQLLW
jgi:hypothetical protein